MPIPEKFLVRDYMTQEVSTLPKTASLLEAALLLRKTFFRHLPVVDGDKLVGILTDRDISRLAPSMLEKITPDEYNSILESTTLERVMTRDPLTVFPDTPLVEAVALLHHKKLGCLPVVEKGKLVGIITVTDMLGLLHRFLGGRVVSEFELEGI